MGDIVATRRSDGSITLAFTRVFVVLERKRTGRARVVVNSTDGGSLRIVEETDEETERAAPSADCEATAARVVKSLPEVAPILERFNQRARGTDDGSAPVVGEITQVDEFLEHFWILGEHPGEPYEPKVWWGVDGAGHLSVSVFGSRPTVSQSDQQSVEQACRH